MSWQRFDLNPFGGRSGLGIHTDYDLDVLVIPWHSNQIEGDFEYPRRVVHFDGENFELVFEEKDSWANDYHSGDSWSSPSSPNARGVIHEINHGQDIYFSSWEYSLDKGFNWIRFRDINDRNPDGRSLGSKLYQTWKQSQRVQFRVSNDLGHTYQLVYDEQVSWQAISDFYNPKGNASGNVIICGVAWYWAGGWQSKLAVSYDAGANWHVAHDTYDLYGNIPPNYTAIDPAGMIMMAATDKNLYRVSNGGIGFGRPFRVNNYFNPDHKLVIMDLQYLHQEGLVFMPIGNRHIGFEHIVFSQNHGASWEELPMPTPILGGNDGWSRFGAGARGMQVAYYKGYLYLKEARNSPLWRTNDFGETWEPIWHEYDIDDDEENKYWINGVCTNKIAHEGLTLAATFDSFHQPAPGNVLALSTDFGKTWKYCPYYAVNDRISTAKVGLGGSAIATFARGTHLINDTTNYARNRDWLPGFIFSFDHGNTWEYKNVGDYLISESNPDHYTLMANWDIDDAFQSIVFRPFGQSGVYYSSDRGSSFTNIASDIIATNVAISGNGQVIYFVHDSRMYYTTDFGETLIDTGSATGYIMDFQVNFDGTIAIGIISGMLFIWTDGERFISSTGVGPRVAKMASNGIDMIVVGDPNKSATSIDAGQTWQTLDPGEINLERVNFYNQQFVQGYSLGATWDAQRRFLSHNRAPYLYYGEGFPFGIIKAISSVLYRLPRESQKVATVFTFQQLKKISSQADNPLHLD